MKKVFAFTIFVFSLSACNTAEMNNGQKLSNAVGVASIVGAGISAANGNYSSASRILEVGSNSMSKFGTSQNTAPRVANPNSTAGGGSGTQLSALSNGAAPKEVGSNSMSKFGTSQNTAPRVANLNSTAGGGSGIQLSTLSIGAAPKTIALSGRCGLPRSAVSESDRRRWYNEANKKLSFGPFQGDASAAKEIRSVAFSGNKCDATARQVYAFLPSLNGSITAANRLYNGTPPGLKCPAGGGAAPRSACQSTQIVYAIKTTAFMCHEVCK